MSAKKKGIRMLKEYLAVDREEFSPSTTLHHPPPPSTTSLQRLLRRSIQFIWKSKNRNKNNYQDDTCRDQVKVKVKDILRWTSFCEVKSQSQSQPLDLVEHGPTSSTGSSSSGSRVSSWGGSEYSFTVDELPRWWAHGKLCESEWGPNCVDVADGDLLSETTETTDSAPVEPHVQDIIASEDDKEQHSPVSVLDSSFRDEILQHDFLSSFDQSLASVERTKQRLLQSIQWFESLAGVDDLSSLDEEDKGTESLHEEEALQRKEYSPIEGKSTVYLTRRLCWFKKGKQSFNEKQGCIKDMERQEQWPKFGEEKEELGMELEVGLLHDLVEEVFIDLFG